MIVLALWVGLLQGPVADVPPSPCLDCHRAETPGLVRVWLASAHAREKVGCASCHDADPELCRHNAAARTIVDATVCAQCHEKAAASHGRGKHGIAGRAGRACTRNAPRNQQRDDGCGACHEAGSALPRERASCGRFLTASPAMQRQGCMGCHRIEKRCDTCHTAHGTSGEIAGAPGTCGKCHMGPDHPQYEMWKTSSHGVIYEIEGAQTAPSCVTCHMTDDADAIHHDVSRGISMGLAGQPYPPEVRAQARSQMLDVCARCHARSFAARNLADGDTIQRESKAIVDEARAIIEALDREGLLQPAPQKRPPHPLSGPVLELGPHMLYQDLSRVEAVFFRLKKYDYVTSYKGVFHQNPDYAHWLGHASLKLALSEIQSDAALLRAVDRVAKQMGLMAIPDGSGGESKGSDIGARSTDDDLKRALIRLRARLVEGRITPQEFEKRKAALLDRHGL